ncbi:MAG TPA: hypothetical protein VEA35_18965 [Ramlibacter sp.]|nr:hypothetical protein [Candidatus Limnocylindrales bacterium]HYF44514.1 hypothetical protein [Ramlibacter sp.]
MSDQQLPDPLVPAEVDLNGYGFMPMLHHRVLQSTLFVKSTGDEFKAAFALWCAAWSEKPAGTLPEDEEMLEHLSRAKAWKKVRARAMHGWILCSDGRYHHPVLATLAIEAWERREEFREKKDNQETRQERWRKRVKELSEQLRALGVTPPRNASLEKLETLLRDAGASQRETHAETRVDGAVTSRVDGAEMALTGTGETGRTGRTEKQERAATATTVARAPTPAPAQEPDPPEANGHAPTPAGSACRVMRQAGLQGTNPGDPRLLALLEQGATPAEFAGIAAEAVAKGKGWAWVLTVLPARRAEAASIALAPPAPAAPPAPSNPAAAWLAEQAERAREVEQQRAARLARKGAAS